MNKLRQHEERLAPKLVEKFFNSIDERESKEKCWNWTGPIHSNGYARLAHGSREGPNFYFDSGHRFSYRMHMGEEIPQGMQVNHKCDNRRCVNPFHLFLGTQMDNMKDKIAKGRDSRGKTHSLATAVKTPRGSKNAAAKLVEADIPNILNMKKNGKTNHEIATFYGVSKSCIGNLFSGLSWSHISGIAKKERYGAF